MSEATASIFTSESVSEGHPDKVADRISDAILDAYLARDAEAKVACETLVTHGYVCVAGEVTALGGEIPKEEIAAIARDCIRDIGYSGGWDLRFDVASIEIDVRLHAQSKEINAAVDKKDRKSQGAGDQGMMFGYASNETEQYMPAPIVWAVLAFVTGLLGGDRAWRTESGARREVLGERDRAVRDVGEDVRGHHRHAHDGQTHAGNQRARRAPRTNGRILAVSPHLICLAAPSCL